MSPLLDRRRAGVLLHISSLPNGDLGEDAFRFVDFLARIGATVWQTLPLNITHADGSPYQGLSAHAGNPAFISLRGLQKQGLLTEEDLNLSLDCDALIQKAHQNFQCHSCPESKADFISFCKAQSYWLDDFSLFVSLRKHFQFVCWHDWPIHLRLHEDNSIKKAQLDFAHEIALIKFTQYLFFKQWHALKVYANSKNIALFGDIPLFISYDSADVWSQSHLFKLDQNLNMTVVAGVPPDYFSLTGQRWGNPHYCWKTMQADGFQWWLNRIRTQNEMFDMLRIDHFRGLQAAWEIPVNKLTAIYGSWVEAPGEELLQTIKSHFPSLTLVAEDLGIITQEVDALRENFNLPGLKILQFAFDGNPDNPYLPEQFTENSVVYTGTHDNDTTLGWFSSLNDEQKQLFYSYLKVHFGLDEQTVKIPQSLIEIAFASKACLAIIPMQDILRLGNEHRMNTPGTIEKNWQWQFDWSQLTSEIEEDFVKTIKKYHRNH